MTINANRRPTGIGTAAQESADDSQGKYSDLPLKASAEPAPWFRFWVTKWSAMAARLSAAERGVLISLYVDMHESGRPVREDAKRLARLCGVAKKTVMSIVDTLVDERCIDRTAAGLWSQFMQRELEMREEKSELARKISLERWKKDNENKDTSMRTHTERREVRGKSKDSSVGGPSAQPTSETVPIPSSKVVEDEQALSPARSRLRASDFYREGQTITHLKSEKLVVKVKERSILVIDDEDSEPIELLLEDDGSISDYTF